MVNKNYEDNFKTVTLTDPMTLRTVSAEIKVLDETIVIDVDGKFKLSFNPFHDDGSVRLASTINDVQLEINEANRGQPITTNHRQAKSDEELRTLVQKLKTTMENL